MAAKRRITQELFRGIKVCVTALPPAERKDVQRATEECGGIYSADLDQTCTHLLVGEPQGAKYEMALTWQLKTVHPSWLWDSIEEGLLLPVTRYLITTPPNAGGAAAGPDVLPPDQSYFQGLRFYAGQHVQNIFGEKYEKMVTDGAGTLTSTFDEKTTHYIVIRRDLEPEYLCFCMKKSDINVSK